MNTPNIITVDGRSFIAADSLNPDCDPLAAFIGKAVFIRTVTMHYTGRLVAISADTLVLDDAAWIADSGRFATALATGELVEVEPFPGRVCVGRGALVDITAWDHALPRAQK